MYLGILKESSDVITQDLREDSSKKYLLENIFSMGAKHGLLSRSTLILKS